MLVKLTPVLVDGVESNAWVQHPVGLVARPVRVPHPVAGLPGELPVAVHVGQADPSILNLLFDIFFIFFIQISK